MENHVVKPQPSADEEAERMAREYKQALALSADETTTVVTNLSSFPGRSACDGMAIYIRSADGGEIGEPTLLVGAIRAMSTEYTGSQLADVIRTEAEPGIAAPSASICMRPSMQSAMTSKESPSVARLVSRDMTFVPSITPR